MRRVYDWLSVEILVAAAVVGRSVAYLKLATPIVLLTQAPLCVVQVGGENLLVVLQLLCNSLASLCLSLCTTGGRSIALLFRDLAEVMYDALNLLMPVVLNPPLLPQPTILRPACNVCKQA